MLASLSARCPTHIETTGPTTFARPRRVCGEKLAVSKQEFKFLEENSIVRHSNSSYSSPLHMVFKPDGSHRSFGNYKRLNSSTVPNKYPLPHIQDFSTQLHGCNILLQGRPGKRVMVNILVASEDHVLP